MNVYFAGPDVFYDNAIDFGEYCKKTASQYGMIGMFPMDNEISNDDPDPGRTIYLKNREMLDASQFVVVNLNDFRGYDPDAGTVWELAYAVAKGKKVIGYMAEDKTLVERHVEDKECLHKDGHFYDKRNRKIENFGNNVNLMLQYSVDAMVIGEVKDALNYIYTHFLMPAGLDSAP